MPRQTRTRATKLQKENAETGKKVTKQNGKLPKYVANSTRKPLADKTNSLSDTDATLPPTKPASKVKENDHKSVKVLANKPLLKATEKKSRPTRNCRLKSAKDKSISSDMSKSSPFKTPSKDLESSLIVKRPKRICRLPSKFEDHFVSPSKLIPLQPCHASTPIVEKKTVQPVSKNTKQPDSKDKKSIQKLIGIKVKMPDKNTVKVTKQTKVNIKENASISSLDKSSPDTNNNGRYKTRPKRNATKLQSKQINGNAHKITPFAKRLLNNSMSFRVLEDKEKPKNRDVYEFTFDPDDEPTPQKKKRKRPIKKKPPKPKAVFVKNTYNTNVAKALTDLKTKIKPSQPQVQSTATTTENVPSTQTIAKPVVSNEKIPPDTSIVNIPSLNESNNKASLHESNYASIRVEDIAADFEPIENHDDINYSPVNSPLRSKTPEISIINDKDPLNLQEDMSIFNDQPVASSSMNVSARHPLASPWRVEFGSLPIKWQANTYIKPNMTPAVECSFINAEDLSKKKHVYTNMLVDDEPQEESPVLTQPSIISFMRQAAERSLNRKRKRQPSPAKTYIFDDLADTSDGRKTPKKAKLSKASISDNSGEKSSENSLNISNKSLSPAKQTEKDKDCTYFGFDDSENVDQENVSPVKNKIKRSARGLKARAVLKEQNAQKGPTRAVMSVSAKSKLTSSEVVEQLYDQLKSAEDAPLFPVKETNRELRATTIEAPLTSENNEDSDSVHLFEDLELIHHLKPQRKSYSNPKKVAFQRNSSDSDTQDDVPDVPNIDFEDIEDPSFHLPNVKEKKTNKKKNQKKKQLLKKEEKEVEEWAAGFNSMCEDIEEFPLVVE